MPNTLYVVGTPIGNLSDLSPRAAETLSAVDFIAAEDTRVTVKLLNHLGIKTPMISFHKHNTRERIEQILSRLTEGEDGAIVSDAGMPCISDPGEELVRACHQRGVRVVAIPGPNAAVTALAVSGLPTGRFCFEGFLSTARKSRMEHLHALKTEERTMVFYEAPHKLLNTLQDLLDVLGDRTVAMVRELTKIHEEILRSPLSEAVERLQSAPLKGELVLVVEGARPPEPKP